MMDIIDSYIRDTCVADFKHMDGSIMRMTSNIEKPCDSDLLCDEDKSVMDIIDEESEYSCGIHEDNQYALIICRII